MIWSKVWNTNQQKSNRSPAVTVPSLLHILLGPSMQLQATRHAAAEAATNISSVTIIGTQHFTIIYFGDGRKIETKESKPFLSSYD